jgi:hypothetical protein
MDFRIDIFVEVNVENDFKLWLNSYDFALNNQKQHNSLKNTKHLKLINEGVKCSKLLPQWGALSTTISYNRFIQLLRRIKNNLFLNRLIWHKESKNDELIFKKILWSFKVE